MQICYGVLSIAGEQHESECEKIVTIQISCEGVFASQQEPREGNKDNVSMQNVLRASAAASDQPGIDATVSNSSAQSLLCDGIWLVTTVALNNCTHATNGRHAPAAKTDQRSAGAHRLMQMDHSKGATHTGHQSAAKTVATIDYRVQQCSGLFHQRIATALQPSAGQDDGHLFPDAASVLQDAVYFIPGTI